MPKNVLTLSEVAQIHAVDLELLEELAPATIRNYKATYGTFNTHFKSVHGRDATTADVTLEGLESYFREYIPKHSPKARALRRSNWAVIVKWLMRRDYLPYGPNFAEDIPKGRTTAANPRDHRLSDDELLQLLKVAKRSHLRDYFAVLLIRFTGRRSCEVFGGETNDGIRWGDIRWDDGYIEWDDSKRRTKGQRMPLTPPLRAVLEEWRRLYAKALGVDEPFGDWMVFPALTAIGPALKGQRRRRDLAPNFRVSNPDRIIKPLLKASGLWKGAGDGWHVLRKTFANQRKQVATGSGRADAWELTQTALHHASPDTTRIYVNMDEVYEGYAAWAMSTPEMGTEAMTKIPELSALGAALAALDTKEEPAPAVRADAGGDEGGYTADQDLATVIPLTSRRRLRALG